MGNNQKILYEITTANSIIIGTKKVEFVQDRLVEVELLKQDDKHLFYSYLLINQHMQGTALIHQWAADMEDFQTPLYFITDLESNIVGMSNLDNLQEKWHNGYREKMQRKYAKVGGIEPMIKQTDAILQDVNQLAKAFLGYSHYKALFKSFCPTITQNKEFPFKLKRFFGDIDLPIIIKQTVKSTDNNYQISKNGCLDEVNFDMKNFTRMLKDLTNIYNLKVGLQVELEEEYVILDNRLETADLFLQAYVPNYYQVTIAHQIKLVKKKNEKKDFEEPFNRWQLLNGEYY